MRHRDFKTNTVEHSHGWRVKQPWVAQESGYEFAELLTRRLKPSTMQNNWTQHPARYYNFSRGETELQRLNLTLVTGKSEGISKLSSPSTQTIVFFPSLLSKDKWCPWLTRITSGLQQIRVGEQQTINQQKRNLKINAIELNVFLTNS